MGFIEGIGDWVRDLAPAASNIYTQQMQYKGQQAGLDAGVEIARINAQSDTAQVVATSKSKRLLYLGIGILGAAYMLFTLRRME